MRQIFFFSTVVLLIVLIVVMYLIQTEPSGIWLQLAFSAQQAKQIVESWDEHSRELAMLAIGLDFLFICCYVYVLSHILIYLPELNQSSYAFMHWTRTFLVLCVPVAGILDVIENYELANLILFPDCYFKHITVTAFSAIKFVIVICVILFVLSWLVLKALSTTRLRSIFSSN